MRTRIKICGITNPDDARAAADTGADAIGLVFVPDSPRTIKPAAGARIMDSLPPFVSTVGLFRDPTLDEFLAVEESCPTTYTQLHGTEPEKLVRQCGPLLIKAIHFDSRSIADDLARWDGVDEVDAILVDGSPGGQGATLDWVALAQQTGSLSKPLILAGGLTPQNVGEAISIVRPYAVDVSTGVEQSPGIKDKTLMRAFCDAVHTADTSMRRPEAGE